jgi:ribosomal-protein-alanine N-acetyltransferase
MDGERMLADRRLRTTRLALRPLQTSDSQELHALWTNERVRRFLWDGEAIPIERTREIVETSARLFAERGFGLWALHEHGSYELLGFAGYQFFRTPPTLELVFGVASRRWGQGFATEAGRAVIRYGFDVLGFDGIAASADVPNAASRRVLDKLGMRFQHRAAVDGLRTCFYTLTREDWRSASQQSG